MPLGPSQNYLARYNSLQLPGYVQSESFDSSMNIASHQAAFADGSESEYTGLQNKVLSLRLKVWEQNYLACKEQVQLGATMLRSKRNTFAPLYVQYTDRHYDAMVTRVSMQKDVPSSTRTLEYEAQFECKPWLVGEVSHTVTGTGTINTDGVGRTISNGGWTPTTITLTGTNITLSGYTATGDFAGFMSVTGSVTNLIVNTENYTATIAGVNANAQMAWADYRVYAGPGKTYFTSTGASSVSINYYDRWYI